MRLVSLAALLLAGCLSGSYFSDMQTQAHDMAVPGPPPPDMLMLFNFDLTGLDLSGLSNCQQLNACEQGKTPAQALMCQMNATPTARAKEASLQSCFKTWCPAVADMGMGRCAPIDMGVLSSDCTRCINNTYVGASASCTPANAPECHMCLAQAELCTADK
jgi:hypothetical protein